MTSVASVQQIGRAVAAALFCLGVGLWADAHADALQKRPLTFVTGAGNHSITVEVAENDQQRSTGLMFRQSLGDNEGMIFLYPRDEEITMWMKNTYISLDMIFVQGDGAVARIEEATEPFSERLISSGAKVRAVIEMKAGSAKRLGLKSGDKVDYPAFK